MKFKEIKKCYNYFLLPYKGNMLPCNTKEGAFALLKALEQSEECRFDYADILQSYEYEVDDSYYERSLYYKNGHFCVKEVTTYSNGGVYETYFRMSETFDEAVNDAVFLTEHWEIVY